MVPESADQGYWPISFTEDAGVAYVSTWIDAQRVNASISAPVRCWPRWKASESLDMIGPIGVLARNR